MPLNLVQSFPIFLMRYSKVFNMLLTCKVLYGDSAPWCLQICSLRRGGIAERGGVRVGHRIIEINGQSVVATPHEKIVQILSNAMGEVRAATPSRSYTVTSFRFINLD